MRGKVDSPHIKITNAGITPAYAGKREFKNAAAGMDEDHPRLCGEKQLCQLFLCFVQGSPPPMRGKACATLKPPIKSRITPAYAGKSFLKSIAIIHSPGSPPPMRGKD